MANVIPAGTSEQTVTVYERSSPLVAAASDPMDAIKIVMHAAGLIFPPALNAQSRGRNLRSRQTNVLPVTL
jgi:hypothetical protein